MRFTFDLQDTQHAPKNDTGRQSPTPEKEEIHWTPLQSHPSFAKGSYTLGATPSSPRNLIAWDGASRVYYWDVTNRYLHRISLRLGEPDPSSVLAACPSKVLIPDTDVDFEVNRISINRNGSSVILFGSNCFCLMHLYGRASSQRNGITCRTLSVGSPIYSAEGNPVRVLQILWHPYSSTHVGILSSDSVFRMFNLSVDLLQPEQEYYLQPARSLTAASLCPADFSFGTDHWWDKFTVFVLFADASIYLLCPVVPFGSLYKWSSIAELFDDATTHCRNSSDHRVRSNSNFAISWLEATFPGLGKEPSSDALSVIQAHPFALLRASLCLQGPLRNLHHVEDDLNGREIASAGRAVSLLYNVVGKDSILVTSWSSGLLHIDSLVDEIHPVWINDAPPRIRGEFHEHLVGISMICESKTSEQHPRLNIDNLPDVAWMGHPPPILRIAEVDLAFPKKVDRGAPIMMFVDPLMDQRIFMMHDGGVDSVTLHFLPFTSPSQRRNEPPSVNPVLNTCQSEHSPSPLNGFVAIADSFGYSWVVALTFSLECVVLEMKSWDLSIPFHVSGDGLPSEIEDSLSRDAVPHLVSKELLSGPNTVLLPQASLKSVAADSIEGRQALHQYQKLFHETYVEYAHKVYLELTHHWRQLKRTSDDHRARLKEARGKLLKVEERETTLDRRIDGAVRRNSDLINRLQRLRSLPGIHKKPLSQTELKFKAEIDDFMGVELDSLHKCVNTLKARVRKLSQAPKLETKKQDKAQNVHLSKLQNVLEKLTLMNDDNMEKVKLVDSALKGRESNNA